MQLSPKPFAPWFRVWIICASISYPHGLAAPLRADWEPDPPERHSILWIQCFPALDFESKYVCELELPIL